MILLDKKGKGGFLERLKSELGKVSWTDRKELIFISNLVLFSTFVLGIIIYGVDLVIKLFLAGFERSISFIFG